MLVTLLPPFSAPVDETLKGLEICKREMLMHTCTLVKKTKNNTYILLTSLQSHQIGLSGAGI